MPLVVPMAVAGVLSIVRDDILSSAVSSGLSLLGALQSSSSPELKASLEELDVEAVLRTVEAVVNEVESDFNRHTHPHTQHTKPNANANATTTTTTGAANEKELESGWVSIPKTADAATTTTATATAAADSKSAAPATALAAATSPVAASGSAAVVTTKFTARKKSSLLNCAGNTAVALSVDQIEDAVSKIHAVLLELDAESRAHSAKYFAAWRSNGFAPLLERLRALQGVLDKRLDLLLKVLSVKSLTTQQLNWAHTHPHAHTTTTTAATTSASANASVSTIAAASAIAKPK